MQIDAPTTTVYQNGAPAYNYSNGVKSVDASSLPGNQSNPNVLFNKPATTTNAVMPQDNPTTLYSGNVENKYIPDQNSRLDKLSQVGPYNDQNGNSYYANGDQMDTSSDDSDLMSDPSYKMLDDLRSKNDATTDSYISSIQDSYKNSLIPQQENQNAAQAATMGNTLLRYGASRTGSGIAAGASIANAGLQAISDLTAKENQAVAEARQAQQSGDAALAEKQIGIAEDLRTQKQTQAKAMADQQTQASRDTKVADMVSQGITDPAKLLDSLNYDAQGNPTGSNFTADEVGKVLDTVLKNTGAPDLTKLSSDLSDYYILKENNLLPPDIASLPEGDQLFAFTKAKNDAARATKTTSSSGGSAGAKPTVSGTLTYTAEDKAEDSKLLNASRGADGYVDPTTYQKLYQSWIDAGGQLEDFLKEYPAKNYINPSNNWLPSFLMPGGKQTSASAGGSTSSAPSATAYDQF